jgi:hypothetical protein
MARTARRFKQADLARAAKAAIRAGIEIALLRIEPDGAIVIVPKGAKSMAPSPTINEWDE